MLLSFTVPASASLSNEMILHAVVTAGLLRIVTAAFVFHSGNVIVGRMPRKCHGLRLTRVLAAIRVQCNVLSASQCVCAAFVFLGGTFSRVRKQSM